LPEPLFEIFDMLMREETRHIVFFVNWMAWQQVAKGRVTGWLRGATAARYYCRAIARLVRTIRRGQRANNGRDFSATQAKVFLDGFTFGSFVEACYAEHLRRMKAFDPDLLQPGFLPKLAGIALTGRRLGAGMRAARDDAA